MISYEIFGIVRFTCLLMLVHLEYILFFVDTLAHYRPLACKAAQSAMSVCVSLCLPLQRIAFTFNFHMCMGQDRNLPVIECQGQWS